MDYWVIIDEEKLGPLSLEELGQLDVVPDTPVWRPGLADWCRAGSLEELDCVVRRAPVVPVPPLPRPRMMYGGQVPGAPAAGNDPRRQEPMPQTYLAWSIVVTLLCCVPCGIVAIYYAAQVSSRYECGNSEGSRQASERAQLWVILSIVLGLISAPFAMLFMSM